MELREQLQKTLGDIYTLERELGGGGMSRVFVATEHALGRPVVVKVLPTETAGQVSLERFKREIRLAASLQQANIVPVLSAGDAGGVPYYTMPLVKGESLRAHLTARETLSIAECIAIMRDVARALAFAHNEGVVHRDIKPENILLSGGTAVVTDFGIAKAVVASSTLSGAPTLTQLGMTLGTPAYMAPEQAVGEEADHRADLYALGVVAYEMLTGATPFAGRSAQAMLAAHAREAPPMVAERRADVPPRLADLVMKCLEKEQGNRPQSGSAVLEALDGVVTPHPAMARGTAAKPTIAVLPLANLSARIDDEYFADGMTDDIIAQLSQIASLKVISRTSMMRYKKTEKNVRQVAAELRATHIVEGSVRVAANRLRIVAQLIEAEADAHLWAETFDRDLTDVFAIQSEVAGQIAAALRSRITPDERNRIERVPTTDLDAYNLFLLARHHWAQAGHPGAIEKAVDCCTRALARDAAFARAHGMLAQVYGWHGGGYFGMRPRDAGEKITAHAMRALELAPDLMEVHFALAYLADWHRYDWTAGGQHIARALAISPSSSDMHTLQAFHLSFLGRMVECIGVSERACSLDPASFNTRAHHVLFLTFARRFPQALDALKLVEAELGDGFHLAWVRLFLMIAVGRAGEVVENLDEWRQRVPISLASINFATALAASGEHRRARSIAEELQSREEQEYLWPPGMAIMYAHLGEFDRAFHYLEKGYEDRAGMMNHIACATAFDPLRGDPRFDAIAKQVGAIPPT